MHTPLSKFFIALHREMDPILTSLLVLHQLLSPVIVVSVRAKAGFIFNLYLFLFILILYLALDLATALAYRVAQGLDPFSTAGRRALLPS